MEYPEDIEAEDGFRDLFEEDEDEAEAAADAREGYITACEIAGLQ